MNKGQFRVIGLCGRKNSGKSTVASWLTNGRGLCLTRDRVLHGSKEALRWMALDILFMPSEEHLLQFIGGQEWMNKHKDTVFHVKEQAFGEDSLPWVELSFALALKQVCAVIFGFDFNVLLGVTEEARRVRETETRYIDIAQKEMTGRQILEYFGTNVLRDRYDPNVWLDTVKRVIEKNIDKCNMVVSDVRFENEIKALIEYPLWVLCRQNPFSELYLSPREQNTEHRSQWEFILHYERNPNHVIIRNDSDKDALYKIISVEINKLNE